MRVEIGPVPTPIATAWCDYAASVIADLRTDPRALTGDVVDSFSGYVDTWRAAAATDPGVFRWTGEASPENVEFLVFALYRLGNRLREEEERGQRPPQPDTAAKFHKVLVRSLLTALEREGDAEAHFVQQLREVWAPASDSA